MNLTILLPFRIYAKLDHVLRVVAATVEGSFGLLAHRLDCVAALVPGILTYSTSASGPTYLAIDHGTLIKTGESVVIAVRRAVAGTDLTTLREAVAREYRTLDAQEREMRLVLAKMESGFMARLAGFKA